MTRGSPAPIDPDADRTWSAHRWTVPVIAAGGALGALARHALEVAWPVAGTGFPWATLLTNAVGCALLGALLVHVVERDAPALLRPFLGVGVLGGFTTFSTYAAQTVSLLEARQPGLALGYLLGTLVVALAAVVVGAATARAALRRRS